VKVAVISHSYLEPENQKNILALKSYCEVRCLLPRKGSVLIFHDYEFHHSNKTKDLFFTYETFFLTKAQFVFKTLTMGFIKFKPDVISIEYNPWSLIFLQVLIYKMIFSRKSKIVCTIKKNTYQCPPGFYGWLKKWLTRFSLVWTDYTIAASKMAKRLLGETLSVPKNLIATSHHLGVDTNIFKPNSSRDLKNKDKVIIGYTGRFDAAKGVMDLIEAVKIVRSTSNKNIELKLLGCGAYSESLDVQLAKEFERTGWLELLPPVSNVEVANFLQGIDIFVLPSRVLDDHQEHDAHALLEALAVGIACIGTKSGIIPELLGDGTGYLVKSEAPHELAIVLSRLIDDTKERQTKALLARQKAIREFSLDVIAMKKIKIFKEVLNEK
jgi:glycosyltransferase involved in cell wall biosynthesis